MANARGFVSFDLDHNRTVQTLLIRKSNTSQTLVNIQHRSPESSLPQNQWEALIKDKINKCNMLIVLSGQTMASASGVAKEIKMARDQDVPVFGIYVDGANSNSNLPTGLQRNRTISWNWESIANAISQMMTEGKNKN